MQKEIKLVDKERGIIRITTVDERWYSRETTNKETGLPEFEFKPSMSWIAGKYPKGIGYMQWLAKNGWDEAEAIKKSRGQSGSIVHHACEQIALGNDVAHDQLFENKEIGAMQELTVDEYEAVISFKNWYDSIVALNPKVIATEFIIWGEKWAGTGDLIIEVDREDMAGERELWLIDLKTSQNVFDSHTIQLNGYFSAPIIVNGTEIVPTRMFILQVGYRRNKNKYKLTEVEKDKTKLDIAYNIWNIDHGTEAPLQRDLPLVIEGIKEKVEKVEKKVTKKK